MFQYFVKLNFHSPGANPEFLLKSISPYTFFYT